MSLTLDTLLMNDPSSGEDKTGEWESQLDYRTGPKIKFPLKLTDDALGEIPTDFDDPKISNPVGKKSPLNRGVKVVSTTKKKENKSKLF